MLVYSMKYQPAGFTWSEYVNEPSFAVESCVYVWLEQDKAFKKVLDNAEAQQQQILNRRGGGR